jgi:Ca2+-transporting ATPase
VSTASEAKAWYRLTVKETFEELGATSAGLTSSEAAARRDLHGSNALPEGDRRSLFAVIWGQITNLMILVLLVAAGVSLVVGEVQDAIVIGVIVFLNALIGAFQEVRAERAVEALRELAAPDANVLRDGRWTRVASADVVPGDLLRVEAGDVVSADARLLECTDLSVEEAALTGESQPVEKQAEALEVADLPVGDRTNVIHRTTLVTRGHGLGIVAATGLDTEVGRVADLLRQSKKVQTPLQKRLDRFGKRIALAVLAICAVVFAAGILRGEPPALMLLTAVSLGVAAIPEALPAVVSVSLALGAQRMIRRHALVRRLPAVETLGSVTYACADKTGTLTEGSMRVEALIIDGQRYAALPNRSNLPSETAGDLGCAMALANDARDERADPTERALLEVAREAGFDREELERQTPRLAEIPFHADRRRMSTLHAAGEGAVAWVKGAPEAVLAECDGVDRGAVLEQTDELAAEGLRVLAFAVRRFERRPEEAGEDEMERHLTLLGLVALMDPPRAGVADSVAQCVRAGITPVMVTGDHPVTARAIARVLGILTEVENDRAIDRGAPEEPVVTGQQLAQLDDAALVASVARARVYARVSPEQKIRIVRALQERGEFVAMTGDGVNDAPALKRAEIGIAMGRSGTEVAREAADMVLLDDDFSTIVAAVREGRRVFDNIRKFVRYTMTSNAGEIWTLLLAPFFGLPLPLLPIQILWVNLVTDGLPGLAFGFEPEERRIMQRPPRPPTESLFAANLGLHVLWVGLLIGALSIAAQAWAFASGSENWQSVVFMTLTLCQLAQALAIRSERDSLWTQGLASNLPLFGAVVLTFGLQLGVVYLPFFQKLFHTTALSARELAVCCVLPLVVLGAVEIEKLVLRCVDARRLDGSDRKRR